MSGERGLDFHLRETKRQEHTGLYLKEYTKAGKEKGAGGRGEREKWGGGDKILFSFSGICCLGKPKQAKGP